MVIFENSSLNSDRVILGKRTHVELTIFEKLVDDTFVISIPSLNILIQTKNKSEITHLIHTTLLSFFNFWKNSQGMLKLYDHMLELGFSIKSDESISRPNNDSNGKKITEELEIA